MTKVTAHRTQVYLDGEQYSYLRREAKKRGSIAKVVRSLIDEKLKSVNHKHDPLFKLGTKPFKSKVGDLSLKHDKYLYGQEK